MLAATSPVWLWRGAALRTMAGMGEYEYRVLTFDRRVSREEAKRVLVEQAELGRWELARTLTYMGGARRAWLRRRVIRVPRVTVEAARA